MTEPRAEYEAQPDDCHAHSRDDNHGVDFWRRAPVTDAQYRRVLAERAILEVKINELTAANKQLEVDVDALTLQLGEDRVMLKKFRQALEVIAGGRVIYDAGDLLSLAQYARKVLGVTE